MHYCLSYKNNLGLVGFFGLVVMDETRVHGVKSLNPSPGYCMIHLCVYLFYPKLY